MQIDENFKPCLEDGQAAERKLIEILPSHHYTNPEQMQGYFPDYDIKTDQATFEVKLDKKHVETGNIFVEYKFRDKPSGLSTTKADYFVVITGDTARVMPTQSLKNFIKKHIQYLERKKLCGDDGDTEGFLIPVRYCNSAYILSLKEWPL